MHYVGIDIARKWQVAVFTNENGEIQKVNPDGTLRIIPFGGEEKLGIRLINNREGFEYLLSNLEPLGTDVQISMEATGIYWIPLAVYLLEKGYYIEVYNPFKVSGTRKDFSPDRKDDYIDALCLADILRRPPRWKLGTTSWQFTLEKATPLLDLMEFQKSMTRQETRLINQLRGQLARCFPEYSPTKKKKKKEDASNDDEYEKTEPHIYANVDCIASLAILSHWPTPKQLLTTNVTPEEIQATVRQAGGRCTLKKAKKLLEFAENSIGADIADTGAILILSLAMQIKDIQHQIETIQLKIKEWAEERYAPEIELLKTVPGLSGKSTTIPSSVYWFLGVLGDIERFEINPRTGTKDRNGVARFVKFCGMTPKVDQSGQGESKGKKLTRAGNGRLRGCLYQAVQAARRQDPEGFGRRGKELLDLKKSKIAAKYAQSVTLLKRMYGILRSQRPYSHEIASGRIVRPLEA